MPVPDFSPGEVLTAAAMDSIGLWLVKTQTVGAGVPSVVVTDAFSADYDNYYVTWTGGTTAGAAALTLQLGPSSVSGYNTSYYAVTAAGTTAGVYQALISNNTGSFSNAGMGDTNTATLDMTLFQPQKAKYTTVKTSWIDARNSFVWGQGGGVHQIASAFTDFTISAGANLSGGTIRVYGFRN
jgi:hypothetical protein